LNLKLPFWLIALLLLSIACEKEQQEEPLPKYSLFVSASAGGTVSTEGGLFAEGESVTVQAIADRGYVFKGWEGIENSDAIIQVSVNRSLSLKANFELNIENINNSVPFIVKELVDNTGYILAIENGKKTCYLMDHLGQKLRTWNFELPLGQDAELAPDGSLYGLFQVPDPNKDMTFGGKSGLVRKINTLNQVVWEFKISSDNEITHHDLELLPNGNLLVLVWQRIHKEEAAQLGYISDHDLFVEKVVEINPDLDEIVWEWNSWDHIVQNKTPDHPSFGEPVDHKNKIDIMYNYQSDYHRFIEIGDIMHANGLAYLPELDLIAISVNFYNEVWFIDHSISKAEARGSIGGRFNVGGDLVYRLGNPTAYGFSSPKLLDFNHHPSFVRSDKGNGLLLFNNNGAERRSKAMEFELPSFSGIPVEIGPSPKLVFEYSNDEMFFEIVGGAVRLPNGNTLICEGDFGFWEVNSAGQLLWKYDGQGASFWRGLFYPKESSTIKSLGL
jgi:hypothetical protein